MKGKGQKCLIIREKREELNNKIFIVEGTIQDIFGIGDDPWTDKKMLSFHEGFEYIYECFPIIDEEEMKITYYYGSVDECNNINNNIIKRKVVVPSCNLIPLKEVENSIKREREKEIKDKKRKKLHLNELAIRKPYMLVFDDIEIEDNNINNLNTFFLPFFLWE